MYLSYNRKKEDQDAFSMKISLANESPLKVFQNVSVLNFIIINKQLYHKQ